MIATYEAEPDPTSEMKPEELDEMIELANKLGFDGQKTLTPKAAPSFPYLPMSPRTLLIYANAYPEKENAKKFDRMAIPIRVLQVAAYVKAHPESPFKLVEVWTDKDGNEAALVGRTETYKGEFYLLARWTKHPAANLSPEDHMQLVASEVWRARALAKLNSDMANFQSDIAKIGSIAAEMFATGKCPSAHNSYTLENLE